MKEFDDNDIQELKDIVRIGIVSSVDKAKMTARVKIQEEDIVSGDLNIVQNIPTVYYENQKLKVEPWIPKISQWVLCIFKPNGEGDGFIIGGI